MRGHILWTPRQRVALSIVLLIVITALTIKLFLNRGYVADPQPIIGERHRDLASRIDPNTADWPALAALPNIGEKRAKDIIAYREAFWQKRPGEPAFTKLEDLTQVKGIGPAISEGLREWLVFPAAP
jgi:hypothetical protein